MTALAQIEQDEIQSLPSLVDRAATALTNARTSAEILEAREMANFAYDAAKRATRLAKAKDAHDYLIQSVMRAQADALEIEAGAKRRLADEYDAAQERGEVRKDGERGKAVPDENSFSAATVDQLGLTRKDIHESRQLRDAEKADPGITKRILNERIESGEEPSKAALRKGIVAASMQGLRGGNNGTATRKNPMYQPSVQAEAVRVIVGSCQRLMDGAGEYAPEYIISGFKSEGDRVRSLAVITDCRDFLNDILEAADAE